MRDQTATRRRIIQGASVIGVAGLVGSSLVTAQEETPTPGEESLVRVAHTSPDAPAVDVLLDDSTVLRGLEFGEVSDYAGVQPGSYRLRVVADQAAGLDEQFETDDDGDHFRYLFRCEPDDAADDGTGPELETELLWVEL